MVPKIPVASDFELSAMVDCKVHDCILFLDQSLDQVNQPVDRSRANNTHPCSPTSRMDPNGVFAHV